MKLAQINLWLNMLQYSGLSSNSKGIYFQIFFCTTRSLQNKLQKYYCNKSIKNSLHTVIIKCKIYYIIKLSRGAQCTNCGYSQWTTCLKVILKSSKCDIKSLWLNHWGTVAYHPLMMGIKSFLTLLHYKIYFKWIV